MVREEQFAPEVPAAGRSAGPAERDVEDSYRYFRAEEILEDMHLTEADVRRGRAVLGSGIMDFDPVSTCYGRRTQQLLGQISAVVTDEGERHRVSLTFGPDKVLDRQCQCPSCYGIYYEWYAKDKNCGHISALALHMAEYLRAHNPGDATSRQASDVIRSFQARRAAGIAAWNGAQPDSMLLKPWVQNRDGRLQVSFKVGVKGGRMFVVRNLTAFAGCVANRENAQYGSGTVFNHNPDNFTEVSRRFIGFIRQTVAEQAEFAGHLSEENRICGGGIPEIKQSVALFGRRLDAFFELLEHESAEYEDKSGGRKQKGTLSCGTGNPQLKFVIEKSLEEKTGVFQGILVSCEAPVLAEGQRFAYYIENQKLFRMEEDFAECVLPLLREAGRDGKILLQVGRNQMQVFYHTVLPALADYARIEEKDAEEIHRYLRPGVRFVFYLDAEELSVTCRAHALYGNVEVSVTDMHPQSGKMPEGFRDDFREREILYTVQKYFCAWDPQTDEFHCSGEEKVFWILRDGIRDLMALGEVRGTEGFRRLNMAPKPKIRVGVSVQSDILNLEIRPEDIPEEELAGILESCRKKKKYHRLKNGDFLDTGDETVAVLRELTGLLKMKPKDFAAGRMQIPAYRALCLDKMLEGKERVCVDRDQYFKQLIRNFREPEASDAREPASMKKVLRSYQKRGYQWLRTLEKCRFGGILADDMGLGKTLQVISVLLAAKEEGRALTSLVVCPASLIFNWEEEFARFAPELCVCAVTGTQEDRRARIASCRSCDVLITSYDLLRRDIAFYGETEFGFEITDEAQYIKNHTTEAAKAVKLVRSRTRFALTGTPVENRLSELWSIFDYLMPGFLYSYDVFKREYETQIVRHENREAAERLRRMVSPFILRRLKEDVLKDLPEKTEEVRYCEFEPEQRRLYDAQVLRMKKMPAARDPEEFRKTRLAVLRELLRLRQICCDPSLCFEGYKGGSAKLVSCLELVETAIGGNHRVLLFSQFTSMLSRIADELSERGIEYYKLTGSTPKEERVRMAGEFNRNSVPVFLISLKAGGTGLNLTGADIVIHYDPWWNGAAQNQATDRAHRIGQEKKVFVYRLIARSSVEEKIRKLQETKESLADQIISGGINRPAAMTGEELMELLDM